MKNSNIYLSVIFIDLLLLQSETAAQKYTICATPANLNACEQIRRIDDVECVLRKNRVDCILEIERNDTTPIFTTITGEEALLASPLTKQVTVMAEFRNFDDKRNFDYSTVVLVKKDISDIKSLKDVKYCHPGLDNMEISPYVLKRFEKRVLLENVDDTMCFDRNKSLTEKYVKGLSEFFGHSCRPGSWTVNKTLDNELKRKYSNLIELCSRTAYQENHKQPFLQSLNCLLNGDGDIALTTMNTVNKSDSTTYSTILNNFTLLCENGGTVNLTEQCLWGKEPNPLLIGNVNTTTDFQREIPILFGEYLFDNTLQLVRDNFIPMNVAEKYKSPLKEVVFPNDAFLIQILPSTPSLKTYLEDFRDVPHWKESQLCSTTIQMCVTNKELEKCTWLQQAALNYGVQPVLECVTRSDQSDCITELVRETVDLAIIDTDETYFANRQNEKKKDMFIVAFGEQDQKHMQRTVLIVKETMIKSLDDLQGRKGCFSEYGDQAWLMFIVLMKEKIWPDPKYSSAHFNKFFNESCMPGVQDVGHEPREIGLDYDKLCEICEASSDSPTAKSCKPDWTNANYGSKGALNCLENNGDYALLTFSEDLILPSGTRIMCKNGTLANTAAWDVDDDCFLSITPTNLIITRKMNAKSEDVALFLKEMDERFAVQSRTAFKIFDAFGGEKDLIFKDTTTGLELLAETQNRYIKAQIDIFQHLPNMTAGDDQAKDDDSASKMLTASPVIIAVCIFYLSIAHFFLYVKHSV